MNSVLWYTITLKQIHKLKIMNQNSAALFSYEKLILIIKSKISVTIQTILLGFSMSFFKKSHYSKV